MDRATSSEREFMKAMASLGEGAYKTSEVARKLGKKIESVGPVRSTLIRKGFVYSPQHGEVDYTVPMFDQYIRRNFDLSRYE